MLFLYFAAIFLACFVVAVLFVTWKIFISKSKQIEENNPAPVPSVVRSSAEIRAWLVEHLAKDRAGEVIADDTPMTQVEVIVAMLLANEKYRLDLETVGQGVFRLKFKNENTFEFDVNRHSIKTVGEFIKMLDKGFNFSPK